MSEEDLVWNKFIFKLELSDCLLSQCFLIPGPNAVVLLRQCCRS